VDPVRISGIPLWEAPIRSGELNPIGVRVASQIQSSTVPAGSDYVPRLKSYWLGLGVPTRARVAKARNWAGPDSRFFAHLSLLWKTACELAASARQRKSGGWKKMAGRVRIQLAWCERRIGCAACGGHSSAYVGVAAAHRG